MCLGIIFTHNGNETSLIRVNTEFHVSNYLSDEIRMIASKYRLKDCKVIYHTFVSLGKICVSIKI